MNRKNKILIVISVTVIVLCAAALLIFRQASASQKQNGVVRAGELPHSGGAAQMVMDETNIAFRMNKNVSFAAPRKPGSIMLENPAGNPYTLQFSFYILGEVDSAPIYVSPLLPPGHYINGDALQKKLKSGSYACAYIVQAFEKNNTESVVAEHVGELTVTVG